MAVCLILRVCSIIFFLFPKFSLKIFIFYLSYCILWVKKCSIHLSTLEVGCMSDVCVCVEAVCEYHRAPVGCKPWPREHSQPACDLSAVQCSYVSHVKVTRSSYVSWTCGVYPGWCSSPPSSPRPPASSILTVSVSYFIPPIAIRRSYIAASIFIIPPPLIEYLLVLG